MESSLISIWLKGMVSKLNFIIMKGRYPCNLVQRFRLSGYGFFQAPIITMSQNRQEAKDRLRSEHDYSVNLKAELEIRHLHEKLEHLLMTQWQRLLEIQEIQMELIEELAHKNNSLNE